MKTIEDYEQEFGIDILAVMRKHSVNMSLKQMCMSMLSNSVTNLLNASECPVEGMQSILTKIGNALEYVHCHDEESDDDSE